MAQPLRIEFPGAHYHVMSRGNERRRIVGDDAVPELGQLHSKPSLETIRKVVAEEFGIDGSNWAKGRRSDNASRAVAAYLARRCFGYRSKDVAAALGYSSAGRVGQAMRRVETAGSRCRRTVQELARRLANIK